MHKIIPKLVGSLLTKERWCYLVYGERHQREAAKRIRAGILTETGMHKIIPKLVGSSLTKERWCYLVYGERHQREAAKRIRAGILTKLECTR